MGCARLLVWALVTLWFVSESYSLPLPGLAKQYIGSASDVDLRASTVTLPAYEGTLSGKGGTVYYIVTDASTPEAAKLWGVNHAPVLAKAVGTAYVQMVEPVEAGIISPENSGLKFNATINFDRGVRTVVPDPATTFPPEAFSYSAAALPGTAPCQS
jgi:hypothetical protein